MVRVTLSKCLLLLLCVTVTRAAVGDQCTANSECTGNGATCDTSTSTCGCNPNHAPKSDNTCGAAIGESCAVDNNCIDDSTCATLQKCRCDTANGYAAGNNGDKTCECDSNHAPKASGGCGAAIGESCAVDSNCVDDSTCSNTQKCTCDTANGYAAGNNGDTSCEKALGETCNTAGDCSGTNVECSGTPTVCSCVDGYEANSDNSACVSDSSDCSDNSEKALGESCNTAADCSGTNVECSGTPTVCSCVDGYHANSDNSACVCDNLAAGVTSSVIVLVSSLVTSHFL